MAISELTVHKLFSTPLLLTTLDDAENINRELLEYFLPKASQESSRQLTNLGGWQSQDNFHTLELPAAQRLCRAVTEVVNSATAIYTPGGLVESTVALRMNAWVNVNPPGGSNVAHGHAGAFWSAVYYVDDGDAGGENGGELFLHDPRGLLPAMHDPLLRFRIEGCVTAGYTEKVTPQSGLLVIFPSWLLHAVDPFHGSRPRVSVAFNFGTPGA